VLYHRAQGPKETTLRALDTFDESEPSPADTRTGRRELAFTALGLLVLVALVYGRAVGFGFVDWDDDAYILRNPLVPHPLSHGLHTLLLTPMVGYPQPLPILSQHLDFLLGGGRPWAFHLSNLLLHTGNAFLFALILRGLGVRTLMAFLGAALWAVHPLSAEAVCWATGRKDLLATTFLLFALWAFPLRPSRWRPWAMLAATIFGLFCKPTVVVLPVLILLAMLLFRQRPTRATILAIVLMSLACVAMIIVSWAGQSRIHVVDGAAAARPLAQRALFAGQHLALQLRNWVAPMELSAKYLEPLPQPALSQWGMAGLASIAGLVTALLALRRRAPLAAFALAFLALTFLPASGLAPLNRGIADVYFYIPALALAGLTAGLADRWRPRFRTVLPALGGLVLAAGLLGYVQAGTWKQSSSLWQRVWEKYPDHRSSWWAYADSLVQDGYLRQGLSIYSEGIMHFPYPPPEPTSLISVGTGCLLIGDTACATHWMGELVRHFGATLPNSLRLLALAGAPPDPYAEEFRQAETIARQALLSLAEAPENERSQKLRALFGAPLKLDLPEKRGLEHLEDDPQLASAVQLLREAVAQGRS
jgi:hypothetical protein